MADSLPFSIVISPLVDPDPPVLTSLAIISKALEPGAYVDFEQQPRGPTTQGLAWQISWYYDRARKRAHLLYKAANQNDSWRHSIYDELANSGAGAWLDGGLTAGSINLPGHIYGNSTLDEATGDVYLQTHANAYARRWTAATGQWDFTTSAFDAGSISWPINGIVWHPNLYGEGDGGLVWTAYFGSTSARLRSWRKATNTWDDLGTYSRSNAGNKHGGGAYFEAIDKVMTGHCETGLSDTLNETIIVTPGNPPTHAVGTLPPVSVATGGSTTQGKGALVQHPRDATKMMMVQRQSIDPPYGGQNTWLTADGLNWTTGPSHPWDFPESRIVCSIPEDDQGNYGVLWMIGPTKSILWKPPL